jgi:hypothetical protein
MFAYIITFIVGGTVGYLIGDTIGRKDMFYHIKDWLFLQTSKSKPNLWKEFNEKFK